ncbi:hypothetical protein, partial [Streptomyces sp. NPDC056983]|uniref:hypothetical protein n=1 Tax=Streptomyces sp. NPDC056983 TaxID=3345987 RepID=UPI00362D1AD5
MCTVRMPVRQAGSPGRAAVPGGAIAEAVERQTTAIRELSCRAFPEPETVPDEAPAAIEAARVQRRRQGAATEAAALRRARAERPETPSPVTVPRSLGRTA